MRHMRLLKVCLSALLLFCTARNMLAQAAPSHGESREVSLGLQLTATESNSPPGSCGCFWLLGGAGDAALPLWRGLSGAVEVAGNHIGLVPGTARGLSTVTLLAGPRYALPIGRREAVDVQFLAGAVRGFDAAFTRGAGSSDTATAFAFSLGGAYSLPLTRAIRLRAFQVEYVETALPNGSDNRQRDIRLGAGVVFHPSLPGSSR